MLFSKPPLDDMLSGRRLPIPMRIAVDADSLTRFETRGIGRVTIATYRALAALRPSWEFLFFHQVGALDETFAGLPNIKPVRVDIKGDRWRETINPWQQIRLPIAVTLAGADLLHCPAGTAPRYGVTPKVATIHDLTPMNFTPDRPDVVRWFRNILRSGHSARRVVTASEYVKDDLVKRLSIPASKVDVVGWAASPEYRPLNGRDQAQATLAALGLPTDRPYLQHFGSLNPNKNTLRILDAWKQQPTGLRDRFLLIVSGVEEKSLAALRARVEDLGLSASCRVLGSVPDDHRAILVAGATVMLYPSLAEGFGLPLVDAFQAGTPVLTSRSTCLPEIAGDAALIVDGNSAEDIARGITTLLEDEAKRRAFVAAGHARGQMFTWTRTAEAYSRIFESVARS
jgi:glycosyltransferase involved in cell wall biosynthesis